jgi:hypothetical protein
MLSKIEKLDNEIQGAIARHKKHYGNEVEKFVSEYQKEYVKETKIILNFLSGTGINTGYEVLYEILINSSWTGWELCDLAPILNVYPLEDYPIAVVAYNSIHLIDDGIDGHIKYEQINKPSYYGYLLNNKFKEQEASALSAMIGMGILNSCIKRLCEKSLRDSANIIMRLSNIVFTGMLGESLYTKPLTKELYQKIIKRKSIAYQMMLDHIFLKTINSQLRRILLENNYFIVQIGQLIDDLMDEGEDSKNKTFSILQVEGINKDMIVSDIIKLIESLWQNCSRLEGKIKDVFAARIIDWIRLLKANIN